MNNGTFFSIGRAEISEVCGDFGNCGYLFVFKISGEMKAVTAEKEIRVKSGKAAIFPLCDGYSFNDIGRTVYFTADGELCEMLMQSYGIPCGVSLNTSGCADGFFELEKAYSDSSDEDMKYIFHGILLKMQKELLTPESEEAELFELICDYIDANISKKITLDEISEMFFISKSQVFRMFKKHYGEAPMRYYMAKKVEAVKRMLEETDMRISDIAEALSFSDSKHLTKTFKTAFGILPKDYRREFKTREII